MTNWGFCPSRAASTNERDRHGLRAEFLSVLGSKSTECAVPVLERKRRGAPGPAASSYPKVN